MAFILKRHNNYPVDKNKEKEHAQNKPPGKIKTAVKKFFHMKAGNPDGVLGSFITGVSGATFLEGIIKSSS